MVEYLNESPFVKFKPNTIIRSQGYSRTKQQFVYEWKTDNLGFKNLDIVSSKGKVDIVAVGDSFTEGMGVATEKTWPSILTANGYLTYNLGVQGYAPIQFEGSLRKYGLQLKPKYIIIGYYSLTFGREQAFFDKNKAIRNKQFAGAIQSIVNAELRHEIRSQAKYVVSATYLFARSIVLYQLRNSKIRRNTGVKDIYKKCADEIWAVGSSTFFIDEINKGSPEWKSTLFAFDNIIEMARQINAKVILMYLPHRGVIYYKAATGKNLPDRYFEKFEAYLLKQYAQKNNITFLDPSERLIKYMANLVDVATVSDLPYLELDGHMSNRGYELVADEVLDYLQNQQH